MNRHQLNQKIFLATFSIISLALLFGVRVSAFQTVSATQPQNAPPAGVITGVIWHDLDLDLFPDVGEPRLSGVVVVVRDENQVVLATLTTNTEGVYRIEGLTAGTYQLVETDPPGFVSTTNNTVQVELIGNEGAEVNFGDVLPVTDTPTPDVSVMPLTLAVQASMNDTSVLSNGGDNQPTAAMVRLGRDANGNRYGGFRVTNVKIPRGSQVTDARLRLHATGTHGETLPVNFVLQAEATDNSVNFGAANPVLTARARTQAATDWAVETWPNGWVESPNLAGPIQEVIDRAGWTEGSALTILVFSLNSNSSFLDVDAWDGSASFAAQLTVAFRPPLGWATATPTATVTSTPRATNTPTSTATPTFQKQRRYFPLIK